MRARHLWFVHVTACALLAAAAACTGDDITFGPDSGPPKSDATVDQTAPDAGPDGAGPRLLMTYAATSGELVSFDTGQKQVAGRLSFPGYGVVERTGGETFLLETGNDLVAKLDPVSLTGLGASWNVALGDAFDGGESYADPIQVVEAAPNKAYVLRYNRDRIAVIDPSQPADAGAPASSIDLSALQQSGDADGHVDMSGAVYDASRHRLYVALGNIDVYDVDPQGYFLLCASTQSTLIAIDTTSDTLVDLGGAGPGGGVVLNGYGPQMGFLGGVVLDAAGDRVLVFSGGCNAQASDGGAGALSGRLIEAVDLKTNTTTTLLDANAQDYPGDFVYRDATHAIVQFGYGAFATTYAWDPTQTTLGAPLATAPDLFDYDDAGARILGPQSTFTADGGAGPTNVIAVALGDGGVTVLGQDPFLQTGGYLGNVLYAP
jgi:hypothetical protein